MYLTIDLDDVYDDTLEVWVLSSGSVCDVSSHNTNEAATDDSESIPKSIKKIFIQV